MATPHELLVVDLSLRRHCPLIAESEICSSTPKQSTSLLSFFEIFCEITCHLVTYLSSFCSKLLY